MRQGWQSGNRTLVIHVISITLLCINMVIEIHPSIIWDYEYTLLYMYMCRTLTCNTFYKNKVDTGVEGYTTLLVYSWLEVRVNNFPRIFHHIVIERHAWRRPSLWWTQKQNMLANFLIRSVTNQLSGQVASLSLRKYIMLYLIWYQISLILTPWKLVYWYTMV